MSFSDDILLNYGGKRVEVMVSVNKSLYKYSDYELSDYYIIEGVIQGPSGDLVYLSTDAGIIALNGFYIVGISEIGVLQNTFKFKKSKTRDK